METYTEPKELSINPHYQEQRRHTLRHLTDDKIDRPIIDIINGFNNLPYCFTLQSCYGHFTHSGQKDPHNLEPLPVQGIINKVEYRIAYIAVCIENSFSGRELLNYLKEIPNIDSDNVQFCCAQWFWKRQVNSYALQVEPVRFRHKDIATLDFKEALHIEKIRNQFFAGLYELVNKVRKK